MLPFRHRCSVFLLLVACSAGLTVVGPLRAAGQETPVDARSPHRDTTPQLADTGALVVEQRLVVVFRAPLGALTPSERVAAAARRIDALTERAVHDRVTAKRVPEGVLVSVGPQSVFTVTPADVDTLRGESLTAVGTQAAARLRVALAAAQERRSIPQLVQGALLAVLATVLFLIALRLLRGARRAVLARLPSAAGRRLAAPTVGGFTLIAPEHLLLVARRVLDLVAWAAGLFLAYLWLAFVLTRFAYTRPWGEALGAYLLATVTHLALTAIAGVPGLFTVVLIVIVTRWAARLLVSFFDAVEGGSVDVPWVHPETANPTRRIVVALLWMFAIVVAYPYIPGSNSSVFKGVSVFAGLVLSLGSSGIVNQAMSGLVLMYSRALKPGDYVRVGDTEGVVTALGMLSTKVRTTKREDVTLPNAVVAGTSVMNFSRAGVDAALYVFTSVTIGYDTPWRQVEGLLLMAAGRTEGLLAEPAPFVLKIALSDFYVEYQLNAALEEPAARVRVLDRLHGHVLDCFNEFDVQITSPHYEIDPSAPKIVPRSRWHQPPAQPATDTERIPPA